MKRHLPSFLSICLSSIHGLSNILDEGKLMKPKKKMLYINLSKNEAQKNRKMGLKYSHLSILNLHLDVSMTCTISIEIYTGCRFKMEIIVLKTFS